MKKPLIGAAVVIILALVVWASVRDSQPRGTKVDAQAAELRTVSSRVKATGEITPEKKVEISAKVVGEIIDLPVVEGQEVSAGQLLVEIERDLKLADRVLVAIHVDADHAEVVVRDGKGGVGLDLRCAGVDGEEHGDALGYEVECRENALECVLVIDIGGAVEGNQRKAL